MSTTQPDQMGFRPMGRLGPWFASIWLFFLLDPLIAGFQTRHRLEGLAGVVVTIAFGVLYMSIWLRARSNTERTGRMNLPTRRGAAGYLLGLAALGTLDMVLVGEAGIACMVYLGVATVMLCPARVAGPLVLTIAIVAMCLSAIPGWSLEFGVTFAVLAASIAVFGLRTVLSRNIDLVEAHQVNANLAVENERTRFARDLHDILGHSLTVITVKAELAQRLIDVDLERTRIELKDLERLSRDALADVRRAVEGYRELTLPGELSRARSALEAAEIDARLPNSTDEVPSDLRELFAWTVREGVTNVIRHSGARSCEVVLTPTSAEVRDDGAGCDGTGHGSGLAGLRERAEAVGAIVLAQSLDRGYRLQVVRA